MGPKMGTVFGKHETLFTKMKRRKVKTLMDRAFDRLEGQPSQRDTRGGRREQDTDN